MILQAGGEPVNAARRSAAAVLAAAATTLCGAGLCAAGPCHAGGSARPVVVELYTSQGCSSCPPADALLGELSVRPGVLALGFHVDYWDELGWRDRFDLPLAAQRQSGYARRLQLSTVYTPQMVIDGREDVAGFDRARLLQSLAAPREGVPLHLEVRGAELAVRIDAAAAPADTDVFLVSYLPQATTAVGRGENSGRRLREFNIVRSLTPLGRWHGEASAWHVTLKSLPAEARGVAVLVQERDAGPMIGAASVALP